MFLGNTLGQCCVVPQCVGPSRIAGGEVAVVFLVDPALSPPKHIHSAKGGW